MTKYFKVEYDKANTLKGKLIFWKRKKAERHVVLKDINLDIKKGETVALIGTNGSGKSTLLKLMTKIIYPNSGTIETNGKLTSLLELGAGFHPDFTGRENIYFNASIFGLTREDIENRIDEIIEFSELEEFIDNPIRTYSSGMYMRLAFSVAINVNADILLIDEILAVGDQHFQDKCYAKLRELKASGKTIVIVTHSLEIVKQLCHRAIWIYKGSFKLDGDPEYVIEEYLQQVAKDHREIREKQKASGEKVKGLVHIDKPYDGQTFEMDQEEVELYGWQISDDENAKLEILINDKLMENVERVNRKDVLDVYYDAYSGLLDADTIGWRCIIDPKEIGHGTHTVLAKCFSSDGKLLSETSVKMNIVGDNV